MTGEEHRTQRGAISQHVRALPASGIRKFFDLLSGMDDVISLGVGEPDFVTPSGIRQAAIRSIEEGYTHYTSNYGLIELRQAIAHHHQRPGAVACEEACDAEWLGAEDPGLSTVRLMTALDAQVRHTAEQLSSQTCGRYLTLPEGARVASVRRLPQPAVLALELELER